MNQDEYAALLDDSELPPAMRAVYLVFRRYMDYETGIVGKKRVVDYRELSQSLEYLPARGSRDKSQRYSRDQIKRLIQGLVDRQLLVRLHGSGLRERMVFKLPLAHCDLNRLNEERQQSATKASPQLKPHSKRGVEQNPATGAPRDERHISEISDKNSLSILSAQEIFPMHEDWLPVDHERVACRLRSFGVDVVSLSEWQKSGVVEQFVTYWASDRPDVKYSQMVWEDKFCDSALKVLRGSVN